MKKCIQFLCLAISFLASGCTMPIAGKKLYIWHRISAQDGAIDVYFHEEKHGVCQIMLIADDHVSSGVIEFRADGRLLLKVNVDEGFDLNEAPCYVVFVNTSNGRLMYKNGDILYDDGRDVSKINVRFVNFRNAKGKILK